MKGKPTIDFNTKFKDLDGNEVKDRQMGLDGKFTESVATLGRVAANALLAMTDADKDMTGETKVKRYDLAMRIVKGEASLKAEEIADIKAAIGKHYTPLIVGQAWKMLDPGE